MAEELELLKTDGTGELKCDFLGVITKNGDCQPLLWGDWVSNSVTGIRGSSPEQENGDRSFNISIFKEIHNLFNAFQRKKISKKKEWHSSN